LNSTLRVPEGEELSLNESFLDEFDSPLQPAEGSAGPEVTLYDVRGEKPLIVSQTTATPDDIPGHWTASVGVPILGIQDLVEFRVVWEFTDEELCTHRVKHPILVEPSSQNRVTDIVVQVKPGAKITFFLPFPFKEEKHLVSISLSKENKYLIEDLEILDKVVSIRPGQDLTKVTIPAVLNTKNLEPHVLTVEVIHLSSGREDLLIYKVWGVTPQVLVAASMIDDHIDKARLQNVIPELEYTLPDTVAYLNRGLMLFNQLSPRLTAFTGMNMQGVLLQSWVTCSTYYALAAQLQAEGAMAFDLAGQTVTFNVDRSPSVEAALGRIESQISEQIKETKKLLCKAGLFTGDGSQGSRFISGAQNSGVLSITHAPTTKFRLRSTRARVSRN
jgi:hypothetical protein